jgi:hypothetical protein
MLALCQNTPMGIGFWHFDFGTAFEKHSNATLSVVVHRGRICAKNERL